ncbi:amidase [Seongchinamella sediminis]|uniref:Amidase n=1 Tax=Seongchinamella sediminis TaxID=2283635 RepID=A0A3L7E118_9GAMM|nr:amidase family protein [Seongchinamella sediminis]RLQ21941.1 amidase [Seongchinamella sediminis]
MNTSHRVIALLAALHLGACAASDAPETASQEVDTFTVVEASFADMQAAMAGGETTAKQIVAQYLERIDRYEPQLRATLAVNSKALAEAQQLDRERAAGKVRGPLHGIPIALKDNIHTTDMPTTGGALAFKDYTPPYEATLVQKLRDAGAIIIAKTTLTELANWVATGMPNSYNAVRGYGYNPYDPRPDPRDGFADGRAVMDTGGSSSGIGTAANLWAASVGTETSGSIEIPANNTMLAAIKPTVGRISRHGIIPITADQDTAGSMAKYVADAAALLAAMEGVDEQDPATGSCPPPADGSYAAHLRADALAGARIGIPRAYYYQPVVPPGKTEPVGGLSSGESAAMSRAIELLRAQGAVIVDPANIPSVVNPVAADNQLLFQNCYDVVNGKGRDENCSVILKYGMKRDFNRWLDSLGDSAPVASLTALREFNLAHRDKNAIRYDQAELDISDEMDVTADRARWRADRDKDIRLSRSEGIDAALRAHQLDALLMPSWKGENILNKAGYPAVVVPFTTVPNQLQPPLPDGFDPRPMPFGVSFIGTACSEPRLIELGYAFEQATRARRPPAQFP